MSLLPEIGTPPRSFWLGPTLARDVFVNGKQVVSQGRITTLDQRALARQQNQQMRALQERV